MYLYYDDTLNDRPGLFSQIFPTSISEAENAIISVTGIGADHQTFGASRRIVDIKFGINGNSTIQCFPFYIYDEDGSNRRENITDWALQQFQTHYGDKKIAKWDIFYYVYGVLHHPGYRTKFADNLKRELPRIPFAPPLRAGRGSPDPAPDLTEGLPSGTETSGGGSGGVRRPAPSAGSSAADKASGFWAFAAAGKELAGLHLDYEKLEPYPLKWIETEGVPLSYKVEDKMRLSKDKTSLRVNPSLTLAGIPPEVFGYRLGNRSALDWVIDQYQVSEDTRSGIRSDPNRADDEEYIVRLVGQVIRVSFETVAIVGKLPAEFAP